jgi:hypothetical protein
VVIIVVGILLAGISSGIDLYDDYKVKVAQNLTKNSRVARIKDLELWLETTSENSFALGTTNFVNKIMPNNNAQIGRWNDVNPNILPFAGNNPYQATSTNQPKYISKGINGLPALLFDGDDNFFSYNGNFLIGADYTIFVVEKRNSNKSNNYFIASTGPGIVTNTRPHFGYRNSNTITQSHYYNDLDKNIPDFTSPIGVINSFVFSKVDGKAIYTNGGTKTVNTTQKKALTSYVYATIGKSNNTSPNYYYDGYIAEMIFYTRALTDKERQEVETYLSKKWGIKLV